MRGVSRSLLLGTSIIRPDYNILFTRAECIFLGRLRVNKALYNTEHYYDRIEPPKNVSCNASLSLAPIFFFFACSLSKINEFLEKVLDMIPRIRLSLRIHYALDT